MTKDQEKDGASPYVSNHMTRKQAEVLADLVNEQRPRSTWDPIAKAILRGLQRNAGRRTYLLDGTFTVKDEP